MSDYFALVPLTMNEAGVLLVGNTRVSLDSVIYAFKEGMIAEEIVRSYPTLDLTEVYAVISYYLQNREKIASYLENRKKQREEIRKEVESRFRQKAFVKDCLRDDLLHRQPLAKVCFLRSFGFR